jgi:hypothetical protein
MKYFPSARQAALAWGRSPKVIADLCQRGLVPGAFKGEDGCYRIPKGPEPPGLPRGVKLTEGQRREIARLAHAGVKRTRLAKQFGVQPLHVYHLMKMYPTVEPEEAARVLARHSRVAEEDVLKGGPTVRRAVREAKGNLEGERERLSRELAEVEDALRALDAAADALFLFPER